MTTLFQNILTASFHGSIVILVILLLRPLLRRAPRKFLCFLWLLAGIRLLMPFEIPSSMSLQPQVTPETLWEQPAPAWKSHPETFTAEEILASQAEMQDETLPEEGENLHTETPEEARFTWRSLLPIGWLTVAAGFAVYSAVSYASLRRRVRDAKKIPGGWEAKNIDTAFILGFARPQIYIPQGMPPETRKHILAHERTHLEKGDHWFKMVGFLALALHWFNPLVWVSYILLCKDIEMACDERVVQFMELPERKEYSAALLECSTGRAHFAASPVAFGEVSVKERIKSVLNYRKPSFWVGLLALAAIVFVTVCLVTNPETADPNAAIAEAAEKPFAVPEMPPMEENPDWGFTIQAKAESPTDLRITYGVGQEGSTWDGTALTLENGYWLERWNGESWERLETLMKTPSLKDAFGMEFINEEGIVYPIVDELDLTLNYGTLSEGDYRIGRELTRQGETKPFYAWFHIYDSYLTPEQQNALARCENSFAKVLAGTFQCTLFESSGQGELWPTVRLTKENGRYRVDAYVGDVCYGTEILDSAEVNLESWNWDAPFHQGENKQVRFPEETSYIRSDEICFCLYWADQDGTTYEETDTYAFYDNGALKSIDRLVERRGTDGTSVFSRRMLTVENTRNSYWTVDDTETYSVQDSFDAAVESPWKIHFRVDDDYLNPESGEVWMALSDSVGVSKITTDGSYWLEKKVKVNDGLNTRWERLIPTDSSWGDETYRVLSKTAVVQVDWTKDYGRLEPGVYRMGKRFYQEEESIIQYAEFAIYPSGTVQGEGGEEAFQRVTKALEQLLSGSYHLKRNYGNAGGERDEFWKWNNVCVWDIYHGETYSHSAVETDQAEIFYDQWYSWMPWVVNPDYTNILFPEGVSVISDEEVTFATSYTGGVGRLNLWTFRFDDQGNLTDIIEKERKSITDGAWMTTMEIQIQDTPASEIQSWVETQMAKQNG